MAEDDRSSFASLLVPTALLALILQLLAGTTPHSESLKEQGASDGAAESSSEYLNAKRLLSGHLKREWQGHRDPGLGKLDFLIATVPDPVVSRLDYTFDRYFDAIQRAIEAAGYRLDRFDLPWARARATLDAQLAYTNGHSPNAGGPEFARYPGVLLFTKRDGAEGATGLVLYLVGETPTSGANQIALTIALNEIAALCWSESAATPLLSPTCESRTIRMLAPSFSGSRRSLEIALTEWPGTAQYLNPDKPFDLVSGTVTSVSQLSGLPANTLKTTALPDAAFLTGVLHYLKTDLGADCREIAFLTEGSGFGQGLRHVLEELRWSDDDGSCGVLSLTFPLHLSELRREAERTRTRKATLPTNALSGVDEHIPIGDTGRIDRSVVGLTSTEDAASSELVLRNLLSTLAREKIRYVGLISTDVRDRLFLAREVSQHSPNTVLFLYGADVLYLHSDYNVALRGALVVTPYPLFGLNQLWTTPFSGDEARVTFPVSTAQGVYNAALALLGHDEQMLEYGRPFDGYTYPRQPALWLTAVGQDQFFPISILPVDRELAGSVYPGVNRRTIAPEIRVAQWRTATANLLAGRGFVPDVTKTVILVITLLAAGLATTVLLTCAHHQRSARALALDSRIQTLSGIRRVRQARDSWMERAVQWLWLTKDGQFDGQRWRCVLVLMSTVAAVYFLSAALFLLPVPAVAALTADGPRAAWPALGFARAVTSVVLVLVLVASARVAFHPLALRLRSIRGLIAALIATSGFGLSIWLVLHWYALPPVQKLLLYVRAANLSGGLSPVLPLLLVAATAMLWAACEWRRLHLTDDLTATRRTPDGERAETVSFLDFGHGSLRSVTALEGRIRRAMTGKITELPRTLVWGGGAVFAIAVLRVYAQAPWSVEGAAFDWLWWIAFTGGYGVLLATFIRGLCILSSLQRMLQHLAQHPLRTAFADLQKLYGRNLRVDPAHARGTTNVLALTIEHAARFIAVLPASVPVETRTALTALVEKGERALERSLEGEANQKGFEAGEERRRAHGYMSSAAAIVAELLDRCVWHVKRAATPALEPAPSADAVSLRAVAEAAGTRGAGFTAAARDTRPASDDPSTMPATELVVPKPVPGSLIDANRAPDDLGVDPKAIENWTKEGTLMLASRVADFLNHVLALIRHLSLFVTFGLILMLLATASYPFQPRDLLLALNWSVIGTVVVVSMIAIVRLGRDGILMDLAGTQQQSLLNRDMLTRVFIYGALPILSLLGVQFPEIFNRFMPWIASLAGGH